MSDPRRYSLEVQCGPGLVLSIDRSPWSMVSEWLLTILTEYSDAGRFPPVTVRRFQEWE